MNYIGSKNKLSSWIFDTIKLNVNQELKHLVFADLFAGTGQIARYFKNHVKKVIVNDLEKYSFYLNSHYIGNSIELNEPKIIITPKEGIITKHFSPASILGRMYFTKENAMIIDGTTGSGEPLTF